MIIGQIDTWAALSLFTPPFPDSGMLLRGSVVHGGLNPQQIKNLLVMALAILAVGCGEKDSPTIPNALFGSPPLL